MGMTASPVKTKKMLVAYDPSKPDKASSDFLVPVVESGRFTFFGTKSKREVGLGMVVFVGREIAINDVFARLVDAGRKIPEVAETLSSIGSYLSQINGLKIGQVIEIVEDTENQSFTLKPSKVTRPTNKRPLP